MVFNLLMTTEDYNLFKSEIFRLLEQIDVSFQPNYAYSKHSSISCDVATLRYVVDTLYKDLIT